ncbi:hypothetical protein [Mesorhizobium carmichaelinearum]|uniref:hypothetical protein n=1 Tax=Mesorhizobium carmichaelinearum TaxID=1208188 RepID=UPI00117EE649|nr:hypothetical protein [Mesorhizobium carmichaelinearum]
MNIFRVAAFVAGTLSLVSPTKADILTENCTAIGELARNIMQKRQTGTDMSEMMAVVDKFDKDPNLKDLARQMVILAYQMPLFSVEENKQQTISEFANNIQVRCYSNSH